MMKAFDPEGFLELANQLLSDKKYDSECKIRTAIGRAYYAAFLNAQNKLESMGESFTDEHRIHFDVITKLKERDAGLGDKLDALFEHRVKADYKMDAKVVNLGPVACRMAEHIITRTKALK
jgi:hypothetical protein